MSRAHSCTQMSCCLPSEMSIASFWPSGENRGFAQSAFVARSTDVLPSRVIQSMGLAAVAAAPGTHNERAVRGHGQLRTAGSRVRWRRPRVPARRADRLEAIEIEGHGEERALVHVDQRGLRARRGPPARHEPAVIAATDDDLRRPARQGRDDEVGAVKASRRRVLGVEHALAAGKRLRPPLRHGALAERAEDARGVPPAAGTRMSVVLSAFDGAKMIVSSSVQVPPRPVRGVAQFDRRAAGDRDLLQLAAGEERDPLAIG